METRIHCEAKDHSADCKQWSKVRLVGVLCVSVFIGSIFANICFQDKILVDYSAYSIVEQLRTMPTISHQHLFVYLVERRSVQFLLFLLVIKMLPKQSRNVVVMMLAGLLWGIYLSMQSMSDGIVGLLLGIAIMLPHWIIYIFSIFCILRLFKCKYPVLYLLGAIGSMLVGIGLESFFQPVLLQFIANRVLL